MAIVTLLAPSAASANFEYTKEFPSQAGEVGLADGPAGLAVNDTTGDLYEADQSHRRVLRFDATGKFLEAWGWGVGDGKHEYERCGPSAGTAFAECHGLEDTENGIEGEGPGQFHAPEAIAVDQSTGTVFVADGQPGRTNGVIQEFTATGQYVTGFGKQGTAATEEVGDLSTFGLAVDSAGNVYIGDRSAAHGPRVMEFDQTAPGAFTYDRELFHGAVSNLEYLSVDEAGDLVIANGERIEKFAGTDLSAPAWTFRTFEAEAVAVDPVTGKVFYYDAKQNRFHVISAAGAEETAASFSGAPGQKAAEGVAFNPLGSFEGRPNGVFYTQEPSFGVGSASQGFIFAQGAKSPPVVGEESATGISASSATLDAAVNPEGFPTRYRFEYGTEGACDVSKCAEAPPGEAEAKAGSTVETVSAALSGLTPETEYHYRVVATNANGAVAGADHTFTTLAKATGLPDNRAYELVSPSEKHGGEVFPLDAHVGSCAECEPGRNARKMPEEAAPEAGPEGEAVVYEGLPFAFQPEGGQGAVSWDEYLSRRGPTGWTTTDLSPAQGSSGEGHGFRGFTKDLEVGVLSQRAPALKPEAPAGVEDLYRWSAGGTLTPLLAESPLEPPLNALEGTSLVYDGGSSDLTHIVFEANTRLTPTAPKLVQGQENLYEWTADGIRLVNEPAGSEGAIPGVTLGSGAEPPATNEMAPNRCGAVSSDGSRIFWSKVSNGRVYVREDGGTTVKIPDGAQFECASSDGSRLLLSDGHLFSLEGPPGEGQPVQSANLAPGGGFQGMAGASEDLSRIYFVDTAQLTSENGPGGTEPVAGGDNLYLYEADSATTRFIATLPSEDNGMKEGLVGVWERSPSDRVAQVSPNGRYLAFQSHGRFPSFVNGRLTTFDNSTGGPECTEDVPQGGDESCEEVYEYDAYGGTLTCASCNTSGQRPAGGSQLSLLSLVGSSFPQPRNLTSEGRLYFDSFEALTAADVRPGVENVYEYEHDGQGTCTHPGGCTYLISSGHSSEDAGFFSADESGANIFFTTRQPLVPEDRDDLVDLYDAREGGGFAQVAPAAPCSGEGCRPSGAPAPSFPLPASTSFSGSGNVPTPTAPAAVKPPTKPASKCPKGKVRKHGKCIKKTTRCPKGKTRKHGKCVEARNAASPARSASVRPRLSGGAAG